MTERIPLDPALETYLKAEVSRGGAVPEAMTPHTMRLRHDNAEAAKTAPPEEVKIWRDLKLRPNLDARLYDSGDARRTIVYVHGGGWVCGSLDSFDRFCRRLANRAKSRVVSIGYQLAPEARYPAQVEQVRLALAEIASDFPGPVVLGGDSAGGFLAVEALAGGARETVAGLLLLYPVVESGMSARSWSEFGRGFRLETPIMRWYWDQFLPEPGARLSLLDRDLRDFPPTVLIVAGYDPLHDEGLKLASALLGAGVETRTIEFADQIHGFMRMEHVTSAAERAFESLAGWLDEIA